MPACLACFSCLTCFSSTPVVHSRANQTNFNMRASETVTLFTVDGGVLSWLVCWLALVGMKIEGECEKPSGKVSSCDDKAMHYECDGLAVSLCSGSCEI